MKATDCETARNHSPSTGETYGTAKIMRCCKKDGRVRKRHRSRKRRCSWPRKGLRGTVSQLMAAWESFQDVKTPGSQAAGLAAVGNPGREIKTKPGPVASRPGPRVAIPNSIAATFGPLGLSLQCCPMLLPGSGKGRCFFQSPAAL